MIWKQRKIFLISVVFFIIIFSGFCVYWGYELNKPLITKDHTAVDFVLPTGTSLSALAYQLQHQGVLTHPRLFVLFARVTFRSTNLQAGEYRIDPGISARQLLNKLVAGKVILYSFTIVPGWDFNNLINAMEADPHMTHTLQGLSVVKIKGTLGYSGQHPEGRFFPDTYKFHIGISDTKILQEAYTQMQSRLQQMWSERGSVPYKSAYQALVAASIIEKETALAKERPIISGVIVRRLARKMYLQLDPTVIYGLGSKYKGDLTVSDLRFDTPYNTYIHKGLPPTPICMPGEASIYAALHPAPGKVLYFVAKGDGSHVFSDTLKQHDAAIRKYQLHEK